MSKLFRVALSLFLVFSLANCASKKKNKDGGVSILQPDQGADGVSKDGTPFDATNSQDVGLSLATSGSDTGQYQGLYTVNFEYDKARLTDEARALLASNVEWIKSNSGKIVQLEGHCDERGSTEYNLALGDRRARAVKDYLVSLGIDGNNLVVISYGKEKLIDASGTESAHSKNRRVNFVPIEQ
jgi:peptidoglycan-associated lipoprotein